MKTIAKLTNRRDDHRVHEGYLLLADISGYTAFLIGRVSPLSWWGFGGRGLARRESPGVSLTVLGWAIA